MIRDLMSLPLAFWFICLISSLQNMSSSGFTPLVPQMGVSLGVSGSMLGTLYAMANIVSALLALPIGAAIDSLGQKRVLIAGALVRALASFVLVFVPAFWMLPVALMLSSASTLLTEVGQQAFIAGLGSGRDTEKNFGWFTFVTGVGMVFGPLLGGFLKDTAGFKTAFVISGSFSLLSILVVLTLKEAKVARKKVLGARQLVAQCGPLVKNASVLAAIFIVIFLYFNLGAWEVYLPALMAQRGFSATQIGIVVSTFTLTTMIARPLLATGTDRFGRHGLTVLSLAIGGIGLALVPVMKGVSFLMIAAALCGVGRGLVPLLSLVIISDQTTPDERGMALSLRMMAIRLQSVANPLVFAAMAGAAGVTGTFFLAGALMLISSGWIGISSIMKRGLRRLPAVIDE